ncbi:hypothetical protein ACKC5O_12560 [Aeromonas schubertii]|uniref:hypothetical protein n=1 Tax=Aeromonas schubertii TaxID=652 RepID=UPI0038B5C556
MQLNLPRELLRYVMSESQQQQVSAQTVIIRMIDQHKKSNDINENEEQYEKQQSKQ